MVKYAKISKKIRKIAAHQEYRKARELTKLGGLAHFFNHNYCGIRIGGGVRAIQIVMLTRHRSAADRELEKLDASGQT